MISTELSLENCPVYNWSVHVTNLILNIESIFGLI